MTLWKGRDVVEVPTFYQQCILFSSKTFLPRHPLPEKRPEHDVKLLGIRSFEFTSLQGGAGDISAA